MKTELIINEAKKELSKEEITQLVENSPIFIEGKPPQDIVDFIQEWMPLFFKLSSISPKFIRRNTIMNENRNHPNSNSPPPKWLSQLGFKLAISLPKFDPNLIVTLATTIFVKNRIMNALTIRMNVIFFTIVNPKIVS